MKFLPSNLAGWIIFYLFCIVAMVLVIWAITLRDLPQTVGYIVVSVVSGFLGVVTGKGLSDLSSRSSASQDTHIEIPPAETVMENITSKESTS